MTEHKPILDVRTWPQANGSAWQDLATKALELAEVLPEALALFARAANGTRTMPQMQDVCLEALSHHYEVKS